MHLVPEELKTFVAESNRIEGLMRRPRVGELRTYALFLALDEVSVLDLVAFVEAVAPGRPLRLSPGMDVRVGDHRPIPGGPAVGQVLEQLLEDVRTGADPYDTHRRYETLHPFMDGNGRSGRALWLWQMLNQHRAHAVLYMGFLHRWYYQSLAADPERSGVGR